MMTAALLDELCRGFRADGKRIPDDALVTAIEDEVARYREEFWTEGAGAVPPDDARDLLWLMGWLLYETSWNTLQHVRAAFESIAEPDKRASSEHAYNLVRRLADAARRLVWPHFAPRALGAIRAHALAESKRDTEAGYDAAYIVHQEARERYESYHGQLIALAGTEELILALDEVMLQLALAETGTACRTAERVVCLWTDLFPDADVQYEERWVQRMYRNLTEAITIGRTALDMARKIKDEHGLVDEVDEKRLAKKTGYRNPGIMTARAALLALALAPAMEVIPRTPQRGTWPEERAWLLDQFVHAYQAIETRVENAGGTALPLSVEHQRALLHNRLGAAVLAIGLDLPSAEPFVPCMGVNPLDERALMAISQYLLDNPHGDGANNGDVIAAATQPRFNQSVQALRSLAGDPGAGYYHWRREYFGIGRYARQPDRQKVVEAALQEAESRSLLNIGRE